MLEELSHRSAKSRPRSAVSASGCGGIARGVPHRDWASTPLTSAPSRAVRLEAVRLGAVQLGAVLIALAAVAAAPAAAQRVELPVRLVVLSDGTRRFGVPVVIAGRPVEAGLDTGSTGLRVMARAIPGNASGNEPKATAAHYSYGSGVQLDGPLMKVPVAFGPLAGPAKIQRVDAVSCVSTHPNCAASRNSDPATFGIQGDGAPGEGFAAILGVNLRPAGAPNPWEALGVRRWIVELPRPGDPGPGRIILNPTDADLAGFTVHRLLPDDNTVPACLSGPPPLGQVCAPAVLDTGAPGLAVVDTKPHPTQAPAMPVTLTMGTTNQARTDLVTERRDQATHLILARGADVTHPLLFLGVAPYWRYAVFYDAGAHMIGFRPR